MPHQVDDMLTAHSHKRGIIGGAIHSRNECPGVDDGEAAERKDGEDQLRCLAAIVAAEAELVGDGSHSFMNGIQVGSELTQLAASLQGFPLEQPHEVEVLADGTRQHYVRRLSALEGALPTALDGIADLTERPLEHRAVKLSLA